MTSTQAVHFATTYTVAAQYNDSNGLSATVFADAAGNTYLAIRGTNDAQDLLTDVIDIALLGTTAFQSQYASLKTKVQEWIGNGTLPFSFTVTGHSLGGFLAEGIAADFSANVSHAYLYNSPGLNGIASVIVSPILDLLGIGTPLDPAKVSNIKADAGVSPIAGLGYQVSPPIFIAIEDQTAADVTNPPAARNHSQQVLADALALYPVFSQLDPNLAIEQIGAIVKAASHLSSPTLESTLDALRTLLLGANTPQTAPDDRNAFYTNLYALMSDTRYTALAGTAQLTVLANLSANAIATLAKGNDAQGLATRYALHALNPFALVGADYTAFNAGGALELYDPVTGTGELTEQYVTDRAAFLERKLWFSTQDKNPVDPGIVFSPDNHPFQNESTYFEDAASGYKIAQGFSPATPYANTHRYYFGGDGNDTHVGGDVADYLYGGAGSDTLAGGSGDDYLEGGKGADILQGGAGNDTYFYKRGDGFDTILDSDGQGQIKIDNLGLTGGEQKGDARVFRSADGKHSYVFVSGDAVNGGDALVDGAILIKNVTGHPLDTTGDLGLAFTAAAPEQNPTTTLDINGDLAPIDFDPNTAGVQIQYDALGNLITDPGTPEPGRADTLYDSSANDRITSGGGADLIYATRGGDDLIEAGAGRDYAEGGDGNDVAIGGTDGDILAGGIGSDRLYADAQIDAATAIQLGNSATGTGQQGDWLSGGAGDDTLIAGADNDVLSGGGGTDLLIGGAGNDDILGDAEYVPTLLDWSITVQANGDHWYQPVTGASDAADGGADVIYAGDGADWVHAGAGNDIVFGEGGNDDIVGEVGNDTILGGTGNDTIWGDGTHIAPGQHGDDYLDGGDGADTLYGGGGNNILLGGAGTDTLWGNGDTRVEVADGNNTLDGGAENDILIGGAGNDILIGGKGDDAIVTGGGNDTVVYHKGDGVDTLDRSGAAGGSAVLRFGAGIGRDAIHLGLGSLKLDLGDGDVIHIEGFNPDDAFHSVAISRFEFDDGSALTSDELLARGFDLDGTAGDDTITGTNTTDRINGLAGNDTLIGLNGTDSLLGGDGNDLLYGDAENIPLAEQGNDLLDGGAGDDTLWGEGSADTLAGGTGADLLIGGDGSDIYLFNRGDGVDIIADGGDLVATDKLQFGTDILQSDVTIRRTPAGDLEFTINNSTDQITVQGWYTNTANRIEQIVFGDGTTLTATDFANLPITGTPGDDAITGTGGNDTILGLAGNDTLDGGAGDDILQGGGGLDSYLFGYGMGMDTVADASSESNLVELKPGIGFNEVRATQNGNDLLLAIRGTNQGMTIKDYYLASQTWSVHDSGGVQQTMTELLNATSQDEYSALRDDFFAAQKAQLANNYLESGFQLQSDGTLEKSPAGAAITKQTIQNTTTTTTTIQWISNPNGWSDSASTSVTSTMDESYFTWGWGWNNVYPVLSQREQVAIQNSVVNSDAATINGSDGYTNANLGGQYAQAVINWGAVYNGSTTSSHNSATDTMSYSNGQFGYITYDHVTDSYRNSRDGTVAVLYPDAFNSLPTTRVWFNTTQTTIKLEEIAGGASDNTIYTWNNIYAVVNGGAGNDALYGGGLQYGGEGNDTLSGGTIQYGGNGNDTLAAGDLLYGGAGDDTLTDGNVLDGGAGNDTLDGASHGTGATRYLIDPTQAGVDVIRDSGDSETAYKNWYYGSLGIQNWQFRLDYGGGYLLTSHTFDIGGGLPVDSAVMNWLHDPNATYGSLPSTARWNWDQVSWMNTKALVLADPTSAQYIEPLPVLPRPAANDYAALQPLYDAGIIPLDTVEFGTGIALADLGLSWGTTADGVNLTLDLSWNNGASQVRLVVPNAGDPLGTGVEQVKFADGAIFSMQNLIALAPPPPDLVVIGLDGAETLGGNIGNDTISGLGGDDVLYGSGGNDRLEGGAGNDTLIGGSGNDTYVYHLGDGVERIVDSNANGEVNKLVFGAGVDSSQITLALGSLALDLGNGNVIHIEGIDTSDVANSSGIQHFQFSDGSDLSVGQLLARGFDLAGGAGNDSLAGTNVADRITGGAGNDYLSGGAGNDYLSGGAGNDTYLFSLGDGQDTIYDDDPTAGNVDAIRFGAGIVMGDIAFSWSGNDLVLGINGANEQLTVQGWGDGDAYRIERVEFAPSAGSGQAGTVWDSAYIQAQAGVPLTTITGTDGNDTLQALPGTNTFLQGLGGNDWLYGNSGNDKLDGGLGDDVLYGGAGGDVLNGGAGYDELYGEDGNDTLVSDSGDDYLEGGAGNDTYRIEQGAGAVWVWENDATLGNLDTLQFGAGIAPENIIISQDVRGSVTLSVNGTYDSVTLDSWLASDAHRVEQVIFANGTPWNISDLMMNLSTAPSMGGDFIAGTDGNDRIDALAGDDGVRAGLGDDTVSGGDGNDRLVGDGGGDWLNGDAGVDYIYADWNYVDTANDMLDGGAGDDYLEASISNDLVIGGAGADEIYGNDGNDVVLFNRGDGNDRYGSNWSTTGASTAQRTDTISLGGGIGYADLAFERSWNHLILHTGNGESIRFGAWFDASGQDNKAINKLQIVAEAMSGYAAASSDPLLNKRIQQFDFVGLANQFEADLVADPTITTWQLMPHLANFHLLGSDTQAMGGDMAYQYGKFGSLSGLSEAQIRSQLGYVSFGIAEQSITLAATNIYGTAGSDVLTGASADDNIYGLGGNDTLNGLAGNDLLDGGLGDDILIGGGEGDTLIGGVGDDIYVIDDAGDNVTENQNEGMDLIYSNISSKLGEHVEHLMLAGTAALNGTGNTLDNWMFGNSGNDTLTGGDGNDCLDGRMGADTLIGDLGNDILQGGADNDQLTDSGGNNLLYAGLGIDWLIGGDGNELYIGGSGNDTIVTGSGADVIAFHAGDGKDTVQASLGADNTLSLGGIAYQNLTMSKSGSDLVLDVGNGDKITLQSWYANVNNHSVANLQVVLGNPAYGCVAANPLYNRRVQRFDFGLLASRFDQALAANPVLTGWSLTNALLDAHLAGSDSEAIGGDLAYQYGANGTLAGVGLAPAQAVLDSANFGAAAQVLQPLASL